MEMVVWNIILSVITGLMGINWYFMKDKFAKLKDNEDDIKRVERLLNITREELARDYTTQAEVQRITDHIDQRFNRLEAKIDQLIQAGK